MIIDTIKVLIPATLAFAIGMALTPFLTHYLYKYKAWKKVSVKVAADGREATISQKLHDDENNKTPRMGGIVVWGASLITIVCIWLIAEMTSSDIFDKLDFLSRDQTWIPLFALMVGSIVGLLDDLLEVTEKGKYIAGGLSLTKRLVVVSLVALFVGWWFYDKLEISSIGIPFYGSLELGAFFILLFVLVAVFMYAGGVIDGIDGLAGGVFAIIFLTYAGIAFSQGQINLAAFCAMIAGALLAFLWFNIPPARFYMTETGTMGLTLTLTVIAFMTDELGDGHGLFVLPIVAFLLVVSALSSLLQILSKRFRNGKKILHVAPIHNHFQYIGWPPYKVVMRYWVVGIIMALIGLVIALIG